MNNIQALPIGLLPGNAIPSTIESLTISFATSSPTLYSLSILPLQSYTQLTTLWLSSQTMSEIQALNLLLPHIYRYLVNQSDIRSLLSLAATFKDFNGLYKRETSISNHVDLLKNLYQNIQSMWQKMNTNDYTTTAEVIFAFKNEKIAIYPSVASRSWTVGSSREQANSDGKVLIALNVSILNNGSLNTEDLYELGRMVIIPTLLKQQMYSTQEELLFDAQYELHAMSWEWSVPNSNTCFYSIVHMDQI